MNGRRTNSQHPEDLPWNDVPEDSSVIPGTEEPAPAEVVGDDLEEHDTASPPVRNTDDQYRRDTLSERLAEEEPEARLGRKADPDSEFQALEGGEYVLLGETDDDEQAGSDEMPAEDAAVHVQRGERG